MKRLRITINGKLASVADVGSTIEQAKQETRAPSQVAPRATARVHRKKSPAELAAKKQATANAKRRRAEEREEREHQALMRRIGSCLRKQNREEGRTGIRVAFRTGREPSYATVCPRKLYSRMHSMVGNRPLRSPARVSSDGFRNIVLIKTSRGTGRKAAGSAAYSEGEGANMVRYIWRPESLEIEGGGMLSNVFVGRADLSAHESILDDTAQVAGCFAALEKLELESANFANVFSHYILAMPYELSAEGRLAALTDVVNEFGKLGFPFAASLHKADPGGDRRNTHAHIVAAFRPLVSAERFAWEFDASKATEFNYTVGLKWLRTKCADAFNAALAAEGKALRYSGISQAERGVEATGDTHKGPAANAHTRRSFAVNRQKDKIVTAFGKQVVALIRQQASNARAFATLTSTPGLDRIKALFPNPLKLSGMNAQHFVGYTQNDRQCDTIYEPALSLAAHLSNEPGRYIKDSSIERKILLDDLPKAESDLARSRDLPDIVLQAFEHGWHRLADEREGRERDLKARRREGQLDWFRTQAVRIWDQDARFLPDLSRVLPGEIVGDEELQEAAFDSFDRWLAANHQGAQVYWERWPTSVGRDPSVPATSTPAAIQSIPIERQLAFRQGQSGYGQGQ